MASVDDQEKQSSKSWLRHGVESALIALDRPAGFLVPVGAAVVCIKAVCSFLDALLVYQTENAFVGEWASKFSLLATLVQHLRYFESESDNFNVLFRQTYTWKG